MTEETDYKHYKLGLALSGGGAKGFAHIGAFKLLEECNLKPDIIAGTSAGALMGALFADGYTADEIKELFTGREFSEFAQIQIPKSGLFDSNRFRYFLRRHLRAKTFEELRIPLVVIATDLDHGESHEFKSGPLVEAITASCSVPIIFSPVIIGGVHYVDGGLFRNFPVSVIRKDCKTIIGINVSPQMPQKYKQTIFYIAERSYHYLFHANTLKDRELCDVLVETKKFGSFSMFDLQNVEQIVNIGYEAAIRAFEVVVQNNNKEALIKTIRSGGNQKLLP